MNRFIGQMVCICDVTGSTFEGTFISVDEGILTTFFFKDARQIGWQDGTKKPLPCEWWPIGDLVLHAHHVVRMHPAINVPR